jgi:predicted ester cyclase
VLHDLIAEGDKVALRWTFHGTHSGGPYLGLAATGKTLTVNGQSSYRIAGGKSVEAWINIVIAR